MPQIEVGTESEAQNAWQYDVKVFDDGRTYDYAVTLSWSDYDHWSHGRVSPSKVVHAAFEFLLQRESPRSILSKFDCSVMRRYFPEVDKELPKMI